MASSDVPIHGNYHGYYSKRPLAIDARLALIPSVTFKGATVLDIGCNQGWVTCEIAQTRGAHKVVGVDIDDSLIQAAWRRKRTLWSLQGPAGDAPASTSTEEGSEEPRTTIPDTPESSSSKKRKRPSQNKNITHSVSRNYFPMSCEHEFGSLPIPPSEHRGGKTVFPHNVKFRTADWTKTEIIEDIEGYDVVIAFSISKWIHLNGGDDGLKQFFQKAHSVLKTGGTFILEPQPWESYAKAKRMSEKLKENAKTLFLRPDEFASVLQDIGFGPVQHLGSSGDGGFNRPVDLYIKG